MKRTAVVALLALAIDFRRPAGCADASRRQQSRRPTASGCRATWTGCSFPTPTIPIYPLKPGQEAYADVDGYRIKETIKKITAISLQSLDAGELYLGPHPRDEVSPDGHGFHGQLNTRGSACRCDASRST